MAILRARCIFRDEHQNVLVVESVDIRCQQDGLLGLSGFSGRSEPVAVVVSTAAGAHAVDMNAEPTDLDRLLADASQLVALLD